MSLRGAVGVAPCLAFHWSTPSLTLVFPDQFSEASWIPLASLLAPNYIILCGGFWRVPDPPPFIFWTFPILYMLQSAVVSQADSNFEVLSSCF